MDTIYLAYEGDDLLGKYDTEEAASLALQRTKREAGTMATRRSYRIAQRPRRGGETAFDAE